MRLGINCLRISPDYKGGVNSFTFGLLDGFKRIGEQHTFTIFVTPWNRELFESYQDVENFTVLEVDESGYGWLRAVHSRLPPALKSRVPLVTPSLVYNYRHADVLERDLDVLYVPYVPPPRLFPFPRTPTVYSIHDIQHAHFPEFFTEEELGGRDVAFAKCIAHATAIQASSYAMREEFCEYFEKLSEHNVEVIPEGVDIARFSHRQPDLDVVAKYDLPREYLFTPAQLWPHKNHLTTLRALERLKKRRVEIPLVLTGARYSAADEIFDFVEEHGLGAQVFYLGVVPLEDVVALHQHARLLVTASLYESSSIPILEAAAAGTPIVAGRIPAHEEMAEHLEMRLFTSTDDAELAGVLESAWADDEANAAHVAANRAGVERYSWDNAAGMYLKLFERLQSRESVIGRVRS